MHRIFGAEVFTEYEALVSCYSDPSHPETDDLMLTQFSTFSEILIHAAWIVVEERVDHVRLGCLELYFGLSYTKSNEVLRDLK